MERIDFMGFSKTFAISVIIVGSMILGGLSATLIYITSSEPDRIMQPTMPVTAPPTFSWPTNDPEFLRCGNIIVSYEFVSEGRHLIAIKDLSNPDGSYIMPLYETRAEAIDFMINYFNWLKIYYGGNK